MTKLKTRRAWYCLVVMALFALSACSNHTELTPAATAVSFKTLDGQKFSLSELSGPTLVNFWSTSCGICLEEMPDLAELHEDYAPRGLTVIAVAMPSDRPDSVLKVSQQRKLPFPVALDIEGDVLAAFETTKGASVIGTPTSFLLDANGDLVGRYVGTIKFDVLREKLDGLLTIGQTVQQHPEKSSPIQSATIQLTAAAVTR